MKSLILSLMLITMSSVFANYRCDYINGEILLLNADGLSLKSWPKFSDYKNCARYIQNSTVGEYRCDQLADNDTAVLYNSKNSILQLWDREFGAAKDLELCKRQLSLNYIVGAFRCVLPEGKLNLVELRNTNNVVQKTFQNHPNNLLACKEHLRPSTL